MTAITPVFPANRHALYARHGYSAALRSGDLLFVSGQVGSREDGTPEPQFEAQVRPVPLPTCRPPWRRRGAAWPTSST